MKKSNAPKQKINIQKRPVFRPRYSIFDIVPNNIKGSIVNPIIKANKQQIKKSEFVSLDINNNDNGKIYAERRETKTFRFIPFLKRKIEKIIPSG